MRSADESLILSRSSLRHPPGAVTLLPALPESTEDTAPATTPGDATETEGLIGYWVERELAWRLPGRDLATLLTRVEVDPDDPAFRAPSKPIGPVYDEATARRLSEERGWSVARESAGWRRVVPSPEPRGLPDPGDWTLVPAIARRRFRRLIELQRRLLDDAERGPEAGLFGERSRSLRSFGGRARV